MKVLVVGGGAAGLMAAGAARRQGHEVTVLEHMEKPAQKILVTGKGRCNVTNDCTAEEFLHHVRTNPRFLFSSLGAFPPAKTMELFESLGVELKVERGRRVFPVSDKAEEIRQALLRYADGADIVHDGAKKLLLEPLAQPEKAPAAPEDPRHPKKKKPGPAYRCVGVRGTSGREYKADAVLVATGGLSYPTTGSTGDGYKLARQAGHTLVEPVPSLVSLVSHDADCKKMMGLALKNVTLTLHEDGKAIFEEQGEMLFTHFGISGPLTLSASSHLGDMKKHKYEAFIDLKPALSDPGLCPSGEPRGAGRTGEAVAIQYAAGHGGPLGHRPGHQGKPDHPGAEAGTGTADEALEGDYRRPGRFGTRSHHVRRRVGAGG